jgi:hypothetical protein
LEYIISQTNNVSLPKGSTNQVAGVAAFSGQVRQEHLQGVLPADICMNYIATQLQLQ